MRISSHGRLALLCLLAACMPFIARSPVPASHSGFPGWPSTYEGKPLKALPLNPIEERFAENFPGRIGRFSDGQREIILRWVATETRKLHPAADCFRGIGYTVQALPIRRTENGEQWGRFRARHEKESLMVEERIFDSRGQQWTDASAWYWAAMWEQSQGPWWAITVAQNEAQPTVPLAQAGNGR